MMSGLKSCMMCAHFSVIDLQNAAHSTKNTIIFGNLPLLLPPDRLRHLSMVENSRIQYAQAVAIAARKVALKPKEETASELYQRINSEKEAKKNRGVKSAAKKMIKKKVLKKMTSYFGKK
jgi:hypothetical protein